MDHGYWSKTPISIKKVIVATWIPSVHVFYQYKNFVQYQQLLVDNHTKNSKDELIEGYLGDENICWAYI